MHYLIYMASLYLSALAGNGCDSDQFKCDNGTCIAESDKCDGSDDCDDKEGCGKDIMLLAFLPILFQIVPIVLSICVTGQVGLSPPITPCDRKPLYIYIYNTCVYNYIYL